MTARFGACTIRWELMSLTQVETLGEGISFAHISQYAYYKSKTYAKIAVEHVSGSPEDRLELVINI